MCTVYVVMQLSTLFMCENVVCLPPPPPPPPPPQPPQYQQLAEQKRMQHSMDTGG